MTTTAQRGTGVLADPAGSTPSTARRSRPRAIRRGIRARPLTTLAIGAVMAFVAAFGVVGADAYWLVALGDLIRSTGTVPQGIPFAAADTSDWPNPLVLAQVVFSLLAAGGPGVLLLSQVVGVGSCLAIVAVAASRSGAGDGATALVLLLVLVGSLLPMGVVRLQLLSLVPFALTVLLLRSQQERPSRWGWLLVPLVAVWSNLHGAVLLGVAVIGAHLVFSRLRRRPVETLLLGAAVLLALFATPAGLRMAAYYHGVFTNEAARRGSDLWARPDLGVPVDLLMVLVALGLVLAVASRRPPVWEVVAVLGLAAATTTSSRHGLWLLLLLAPTAATALSRGTSREGRGPREDRHAVRGGAGAVGLTLVAAALVATAVVLAPIRPGVAPIGHGEADAITALAAGRVVLAPEPLAESLAAAGATVWAADPIDAFAAVDQVAYLDFLTDGPAAGRALGGSDVVVVQRGTATERAVARVAAFEVVAEVGPFVVLERGPAGQPAGTNG